MKQVMREYSRKGILFLAAAIGQDKETICDIYGQERFFGYYKPSAAPCPACSDNRKIFINRYMEEVIEWII